jgi:hypothetical protein
MDVQETLKAGVVILNELMTEYRFSSWLTAAGKAAVACSHQPSFSEATAG